MRDEIHYRIALTMIPELGPVIIKQLIDHFGDASSVFKARKKDLSNVEGIGELRARNVKAWDGFKDVDAEIAFTEKHHIQCLFITDKEYPKRLLHCYDPPSILYYRGNVNLNSSKIISIIGTRNHTEYGKQITEQIIAGLHAHQVIIISGLAFGIDAIAHKTSIQYAIPTIGVLAHGLDIMYPFQHTNLAKEMLLNGGLLTEFRKSNQPDKHHFPKRNRIVAGMADATIVIETAKKGGSMITAELAHSYNRDLFAIPGKITDPKSGGCLQLIQQNKAILLTGAEQLVEAMGWQEKKKIIKKQRELFIDLTDDEKIIIELLQKQAMIPIDELFFKSHLSNSSVACALLNLELQNVIRSLPGKMYTLL